MGVQMNTRWFLLVLFAAASTLSASLPRIAVLPHLITEQYPEDEIVTVIETVLELSGRFEVIDLDSHAYSESLTGDLPLVLRALAADEGLDLFLVIDCGDPTERERIVSSNDSLVTYKTLTVNISGRFYASSGSLIGVIRETRTSEEQLPFLPDVGRTALLAARELAERSLMELFPIEVSFTAGSGPLFEIPEGSLAGLSKGMILAVVASSRGGFPDSPESYDLLRSRGILQVTEVSPSSSRGRLLSGMIATGGEVIAIEHGNPAIISLEYHLLPCEVEEYESSEQLAASERNIMVNQINIGGETCKWGLGFGGAVFAGTTDHLSSFGIRFTVGPRIPLSSPSLALRLSAGGEASFLMQDVRNDTLMSSTATSVNFGGIADIDLEWLVSSHLGLSLGATGRLGSSAGKWTVQDENGYTREAENWEIYYSSFNSGVISARAGLFYMLY